MIIGLFHKKTQPGRFEDILIWKRKSEIFRFITLTLEILDKRKLYRCKFHEIVLHPLEILGPKMKTYCMKIWHNIFLINPGNSSSFFSWPLEFLLDIFSTSIKVPCQPPVLFVLSFFIEKRWLLKPLPYETSCGLPASK